MKKFLLYGHGGAYNHGAEAIVRTTVSLLRKAGLPILLSTHFPEQDRAFGIDKLVDRLIPADLSLVGEEREAVCFEERERVAAGIYRDALAQVDRDTVCIGIGGDNYCYPNWHRQSIFHRVAKERGGRSILWGCSVQPEQVDRRMVETFRGHDHIYARESLTVNTLSCYGIDKVTCLPDPAFLLTPQPAPLPNGMGENTIAINISPLLLRRSESLLEYFTETVLLLLNSVDSVLLLPHVTMPVDDDRDALALLEKSLPHQPCARTFWAADGLNASQYKYLISQCKMLICCRTHTAIAGYSCGTPTLAVGYSAKAAGIAADLGMKQWQLPWENGGQLARYALEMWEKQEKVRAALRSARHNAIEKYTKFCEDDLSRIAGID